MNPMEYDINERPDWVNKIDVAVAEAFNRFHTDAWWFDPRPHVDKMLSEM